MAVPWLRCAIPRPSSVWFRAKSRKSTATMPSTHSRETCTVNGDVNGDVYARPMLLVGWCYISMVHMVDVSLVYIYIYRLVYKAHFFYWVKPMNIVVLSTLNHGYSSYVHQLRYRLGATHCRRSMLINMQCIEQSTSYSKKVLNQASFMSKSNKGTKYHFLSNISTARLPLGFVVKVGIEGQSLAHSWPLQSIHRGLSQGLTWDSIGP